MKLAVSLKKGSVILDTDQACSGRENPPEEERNVRKALGLPAKKQLVFYKDQRKEDSVIPVAGFRIAQIHAAEDLWCTVIVILEDGSCARIHSAYLAEMQKTTFVEDMEARMAE